MGSWFRLLSPVIVEGPLLPPASVYYHLPQGPPCSSLFIQLNWTSEAILEDWSAEGSGGCSLIREDKC